MVEGSRAETHPLRPGTSITLRSSTEELMEAGQPVLTVLVYSTLAALLAYLGVLPFKFSRTIPLFWEGFAYASASGMMLGAGYLLMSEALSRNTWWAIGGAALGVGYTHWTQRYSGTSELPTQPEVVLELDQGYKAILQNALHSATEGVAIGVSMTVNVRLGIFMALSLALHNIGEAIALSALLRRRSMSSTEAGAICVIAKSPQVLLAVFSFALSPFLGSAFAVALGFSAGALLYLVMTELLPASYQRAPKIVIATIVSFLVAALVLLEDFFV